MKIFLSVCAVVAVGAGVLSAVLWRDLEAASAFLDPQQLEMVRGRFQQRSAIDRASGQIQQRVREATQEGQSQTGGDEPCETSSATTGTARSASSSSGRKR